MDDEFSISINNLTFVKKKRNQRKLQDICKKLTLRPKKKLEKICTLLFYFFLISIIFSIYLFFFFFIKNYHNTQIKVEIPSKNEFAFIVCSFGLNILRSGHKIIKFLYALDNYVPKSKVVLIVSNYTIIDPKLIQFQNINIIIERYVNETIEDIRKKYNSVHSYFVFIRPFIYIDYLKKHPEIKYVSISDDDTLFFRDPFKLISGDPKTVHIMEDIFPFSVTNDFNYIWTNEWVKLNNSIKQKCGFKLLNKTLLSDEIKDIIPLNSGMMIGNSKNIIKIFELMTSKYNCSDTFPTYSDQGLLNYLDLSGELKELNIPIHRHNIFNGSLISCPDLLPIANYSKQMNSEHLIAVHHYQLLTPHYIRQSPLFFQRILNAKF